MGCYKLHNYATLQIAHTSNTARSREDKSDAGLYKYKFGGHELQDELGLNVYDFQARVYDPAAPHFWQMDPKAEEMRRWSPYSYAFDNPMRFADPDGMKPVDWYQNKTTGNIQWFNGSGARAGFDNIGNSTNVVAGTGQALQLNSNGTATDMNSGKQYGANKTVVVNSSTGTTVKTISASEALATAGTVNDVVGGVAAPLAKFGSTSNIAAQTFSATSNGAVVSDATVDGLAKLGNVSKFGGVANGVGKAAPFVGFGISALKIQEGYTLDGGTFGPNAQQATGGAVGSIAGGYIGAEAGAAAGAAIGVWFGGVGAVPGAIIGGIIGGIGGGMAGEEIGKEIAK